MICFYECKEINFATYSLYRVIHKSLPVHAIFRHNCPLAVKPASMPRSLVHKKTWRDSLPIDMLLSAVSVLVVGQPSSKFPEGLMNYPVFGFFPLFLIALILPSLTPKGTSCYSLLQVYLSSCSRNLTLTAHMINS